jgi:dihydroneopterin aldolase
VTDCISLSGLRVFAHHGVLEREAEEGQIFIVDLTIAIDLSRPGESDDLADTVDYGAIAQTVHDVVSDERWNLIERVAQRITDVVLDDDRVSSVEVTVHKPSAPILVGFDDVSVTIERAR